MNFLQICQRLARECDVPSGPTSVLNQTGDLGNVVNWARDAYTDIQRSRGGRWRWLVRDFSFDTIASTSTYAFGTVTDVVAAAPISRFNTWLLNDTWVPPSIYLKSGTVASQRRLLFVDWEWFQNIYRIGTQQVGVPVHVTVDDSDNLVLGPAPNDIYVVTGKYRRGPQMLATDVEIPEMPEQFHDLVWCKAMLDYGYHQAAAETLARSQVRSKPLMRQLENRQLPSPRLSGALA